MGVLFFLLMCAFAAFLMFGFAWLVVDAIGPLSLDGAVAKGVAQAIAKVSEPGGLIETRVGEIFDEEMRRVAVENKPIKGNLTPEAFFWQMAFHMLRTDPGMKVMAAKERAISALREYLRDEKIKFGNQAYAWDQAAAVIVASEYETDHWEGRP